MSPGTHAADSHPLELSSEEMKAMVRAAMEKIAAHIASLPKQPMHATGGAKKLCASLREPMPERGAPFDELLALLFQKVIPASLNTASPGYLAYIPGGGIFHAAIADLIADATNRYVGVWVAAPGLVQLEVNVIDWFAKLVGLPSGAGGVLTTGGSLATLIAIVAARRDRLPEEFTRGVVYTSEEAHHSVAKAALLAGFPSKRVRVVATDDRYRLDVSALARAVDEDRREGLAPFAIVASAGTTATGAIDPLADVAEIAERERLWLHVDAAYGGFFALTERGRSKLGGIERADSITLDPHKGLFLPYGTGCLLVRSKDALRKAHSLEASYMPPMQRDEDLVDFCELSPELSRDARGLRVWLPLKMHGAEVFRAALDEKMDLAESAAARVRALPHVEILAAPELSLFAFRARPPGLDGDALDRFNRDWAQRCNARQRVLVTGAVVRGRFALRLCILSFRTHADRVDMAIEDLSASLAELTEALA